MSLSATPFSHFFRPLPRVVGGCLAAFALFALPGCSSHKKLSQEESCQERWEKIKTKFDKKKYVEVKEDRKSVV